jgi:hypothetical protein
MSNQHNTSKQHNIQGKKIAVTKFLTFIHFAQKNKGRKETTKTTTLV